MLINLPPEWLCLFSGLCYAIPYLQHLLLFWGLAPSGPGFSCTSSYQLLVWWELLAVKPARCDLGIAVPSYFRSHLLGIVNAYTSPNPHDRRCCSREETDSDSSNRPWSYSNSAKEHWGYSHSSWFHLEGCPAHLKLTAPGGAAQPHHLPWMDPEGAEQGEALEHLQCSDDITVWSNTAEVFEKGKKIV